MFGDDQTLHTSIITLSVKHGGGSMMICTCFAVFGQGQFAIIEVAMNYELYKQILQEMSRCPSVN